MYFNTQSLVRLTLAESSFHTNPTHHHMREWIMRTIFMCVYLDEQSVYFSVAVSKSA